MSVSLGTIITVGSGQFTTSYPVMSDTRLLSGAAVISGVPNMTAYTGMVRSGLAWRLTCWRCNADLWDNSVTVTGISGLMMMFCHSCAGYNYQSGGFSWQREAWIRESVPQCDAGMPAEILADWLEEQGRLGDANYLRKLQQEKGER